MIIELDDWMYIETKIGPVNLTYDPMIKVIQAANELGLNGIEVSGVMVSRDEMNRKTVFTLFEVPNETKQNL
jgi:hypothetical protein